MKRKKKLPGSSAAWDTKKIMNTELFAEIEKKPYFHVAATRATRACKLVHEVVEYRTAPPAVVSGPSKNRIDYLRAYGLW